jgi:galactose mutarotase-like enzyme
MPGHDPRPPSGAQHEIRHGDQVAVVTEVGATLRRYDVDGRPVLDGFDAGAMADGGRGQVLAPWPNRVRDGRWTWDGRELQLALSEPAKQNAAHGLVRWAGWTLADRSDDRVELATTLWPSPGYPFLLELSASYGLADDGLSVRLQARNAGAHPAPYGVGQHPYLTVGTDHVDGTVLTVPARTRLLTDERGNPVGRESVDGSPYDFLAGREIGDLVLDTPYTDLVRGDDGRVRVRLEAPGGRGVELWAGRTTRPPGALASGDDLVVLEPGHDHLLEWGIHSW